MTRLPHFALPIPLLALAAACAQPQPSSSDTALATPSASAGPATSDPATPSAALASVPASVGCGLGQAMRWVGQEATDDVREAVATASGAVTVRWLYPDSIVTQDSDRDRLNMVMDSGTDVIVSARCG